MRGTPIYYSTENSSTLALSTKTEYPRPNMREWYRKVRQNMPAEMKCSQEEFEQKVRTQQAPSPEENSVDTQLPPHSLEALYARSTPFEKGIYTMEADLGLAEAFGISTDTTLRRFLHGRLGANVALSLDQLSRAIKPTWLDSSISPHDSSAWMKAFPAHYPSSYVADPARGQIESELKYGSGTIVQYLLQNEDFYYYRLEFLKHLLDEEFPETPIGILPAGMQKFYQVTISNNRAIAGYRERIATYLPKMIPAE
jgi:hypothetical protein